MNHVLFFDPNVLSDILVPIFMCAVMPCVIVFLVMWANRNEVNRKAEVALKAIEKGAEIDPSFFSPIKKAKSVKRRVFGYLTTGMVLFGLGVAFFLIAAILNQFELYLVAPAGICLFLGVAFILAYFISRKQFAAEIKAEDAAASGKE